MSIQGFKPVTGNLQDLVAIKKSELMLKEERLGKLNTELKKIKKITEDIDEIEDDQKLKELENKIKDS